MRLYTNTSTPATLTAAVASGDTTIPLSTVAGWPVPLSEQEVLACLSHGDGPGSEELITYTGIAGNSLTGVTRGVDGTTAKAHASGKAVRHVISGLDVQDAVRAVELQPGFISGQYYQSDVLAGQTTNVLSNQTLKAVPFVVLKRTAFDRIGLEITTAVAASTVRLGIYRDGGDGYPGVLLLDAGTIDSATTGYKEIVISQVMARGLYWLAAYGGGTGINVRCMANVVGGFLPNNQTGANVSNCWQAAGVAGGALPSPFPVGGTINSGAPRISVRAA